MNCNEPDCATATGLCGDLGGNSIDILGKKLGTKLGTILGRVPERIPIYRAQFRAQFLAQNVN